MLNTAHYAVPTQHNIYIYIHRRFWPFVPKDSIFCIIYLADNINFKFLTSICPPASVEAITNNIYEARPSLPSLSPLSSYDCVHIGYL